MTQVTVDFRKSNEGTATLIVSSEGFCGSLFNRSAEIIKVITGAEAERIWSELSDRGILKADK